jgi:hypothetical protein
MDLNIRNVPESLMRLLKLESAERSMTLRDNVIRKLTGIPSKAELAGTVQPPDNLGPIPPYYQVESTDYPGLERHKPNPDRHDIVIQAIAIAPPGAIAVELRGGEYGEHLIERREIIIQALRDVCVGKRLSMPAEVGSMDKSRPAHDPTTCRVYKCGMCSK